MRNAPRSQLFLVVIACLYGCITGCSAAPSAVSPRIGKISSAAVPRTAPPVGAPLGALGEGFCSYLSFEDHLMSFDSAGFEAEGIFARGSAAYLPGLTRKEVHAPRYLAGRFGKGIIVEYMSRNRLPGTIASAESPLEGFATVQGAKLSKAVGVEGKSALRVDVPEQGGGFQTQLVVVPLSHFQTFSLYVKGTQDQVVELSAHAEGKEQPLGTTQVTLTGEWQRVWLDYVGTEQRDPPYESQLPKSPPFSFWVTLAQPGTLLADALMVETHIGYGGRRSLSSWVEGEKLRDGDIVSLAPPANLQAGTLAFWFSPLGKLSWRVLLCIDNGVGWYPDLRVDLRDNRRLELVVAQNLIVRKDLPAPVAEGEWHHVAVTWNGPEVIAYLDGAECAKIANAPERKQMGRIYLGGTPNNNSPAARADAVLDDFAQWSRALKPEELASLGVRQTPLGAGLDTAVTLRNIEPIHTFARDDRQRGWSLRLTNRGKTELANAAAVYSVPGLFERRANLVTIPAGSSCEFALPWSPALLEVGEYAMRLAISGKGWKREVAMPLSIVAARPPQNNVQVITWGGFDDALAPLGVTSAGLNGGADGPADHEVETATRNRLYTQVKQFLQGDASTESDYFVDVAGNRGQVDQRSAGALADLKPKVERLANRMALFPDVRQLIINSEHQWLWAHDMRPATVEDAKKRFGLDLTQWIALKPKDSGAVTHPMGRLSAKAANYPVPNGGIVPLSDPFYAFHRWWLSDAVGNELFLDDTIAKSVKARAPWLQCIGEPVLRRPALRAFKEQDIVEEWFYYPHPPTALWVQEAAAAAARGSRARIAGMPQFLFKPNMAAPYAGMPAPDMYREAVWHCIARPLAAMTYWNLWGAISRGNDKSMMTQEEIDERLGTKPDWKTAAEKIAVKGEASSIFLWIPELRDEIGRMHNEVVHPLGALLVRWQNRPRQLAVYRSFAGQLWNEVRWPGNDALCKAVERLGVPFDMLYDQDFEDNPELLEGYQAIVLQECAAVTEPAARQLRAFLQRGGQVFADVYVAAPIENVTRFLWRGATDDAADKVAKTEQELLKLYGRTDHPLFIEGMEQAAKQFSQSEGPSAKATAAIVAALSLDCSTKTQHVFHNLLQAEGATYLVAVNDLRVPGKHYGHFGRVLEDGVAQTAEFEVKSSFGKVAYALPTAALPTAAPVRLTVEGQRSRLKMDLPPAGGRVVVFLSEEIGNLKLSPVDAKSVMRGSYLQLTGQLLGMSGALVPGVIPVEIAITNPDGSRSDFSHFSAFVKGKWAFVLPIPHNAPAGSYRLEVRELASGKKQTLEWRVPG